jgi:hypothetical protein
MRLNLKLRLVKDTTSRNQVPCQASSTSLRPLTRERIGLVRLLAFVVDWARTLWKVRGSFAS